MAVIVVDASALVALAFDEADAPAVSRVLEGHSLTAPALVVYEVGNACRTKCRRKPALVPRYREAFADFLQFDITLHEIDPVNVLQFAEENDITFYDASYLWLARRLQAKLVTLDRRLQRLTASGVAH